MFKIQSIFQFFNANVRNIGTFQVTLKLNETTTKRDDKNWKWFKTATICVDGYKFVVVAEKAERIDEISIVHFYEFEYGKTVPAKC